MKLEFTARQTQIPQEARKLAERKLAKIARLLTGATRAHIVVSAEGHRRIVEITVYSGRHTLTAIEESGEISLSLGAAVEKLERQVDKHRGRIETRRKEASVRGATTTRRRPKVVVPAPVAVPAPSVRRRNLVAPEMTLVKAAEAIDAKGEPVIVFRDRETERLCVLFRRKDGKLALVEPE
jgi:putative sigma-54 modulation protein